MIQSRTVACLLISIVVDELISDWIWYNEPRQSSSPVPEAAVGASVLCGSRSRNPPSMKGLRWFERNH